MKRDMDLIRKILMAVEKAPTGRAAPGLSIDGYTDEQIGYHAYLVIDAGLAAGANIEGSRSPGLAYRITHLTWAGHEFIEAARDEGRWRKALIQVRDKTGGVTLNVLTQLLISYMKGSLDLQ